MMESKLIFETKNDMVFTMLPDRAKITEVTSQMQSDRQIGANPDETFQMKKLGIEQKFSVKLIERRTTGGWTTQVKETGWTPEEVREYFSGLRSFVGINRRVIVESFRVKIGRRDCLFIKERFEEAQKRNRHDQLTTPPLWLTLKTVNHKEPTETDKKAIGKAIPRAVIKTPVKATLQVYLV